MNLALIHAEIAKERYLDLLSSTSIQAEYAVKIATSDADIFVATYRPHGEVQSSGRLKGCQACFGSGGSPRSPCKKCSGTGRVSA